MRQSGAVVDRHSRDSATTGALYQAMVHENMRRSRWSHLTGDNPARPRGPRGRERIGRAREQRLSAVRVGRGPLLAFAQLLGEARELMSVALAGAKRTGDRVLQARCLTFFTLIHRFSRQPRETAMYASQALQLATDLGMADYVGAAHGHLGWVAWRDGNISEAVQHTRAALDQWHTLENRYSYPVQWVARLHGLALALHRDSSADIRAHITAMLEVRQHRLPDAVRLALEGAEAAITEFARNEGLRLALKCAADVGYC